MAKIIIKTNENNPLAFKLLIASYFGKKDVEIRNIKASDAENELRLPILILNDDNKTEIFSSNSAACYLFGELTNNTTWLEWEAATLLPALINKPANNNKCTAELLKYLDASLKNKFLFGENLTVSDICIFATLSGDGLPQDFQDTPNLARWYNEILSHPQVQLAASKICAKSLNYKNIKAPLLSPAVCKINILQTDSMSSCRSTPLSVSDHVSPDEIQFSKDGWKHFDISLKKSPRTILPIPGEKNILITSALPYVNNVPHLGNIIGCVLSADIFARYCRLCNYNTLYISGTDEYGTATETKALAEGLTPKQICDKYFDIHNSIYRWFGIGFDYFGRTTTKEQSEISQDMFLKLNEKGMITTQTVQQLLCTGCNRFLADRFVEGTCPYIGCGYEDARGDQCDGCGKLVNAIELKNPRCKVCNNAPVIRDSTQFFLRLPEIEQKLKNWFESSQNGWTNNAKVITQSWLKEGLKDRCITRDLKWGVQVPLKGYEDKVFYVWFDAPIGYMSITSRYTKEWRKWWQPKPDTDIKLYQFMAKDNVPFHSVMFPATLLGLNDGYTMVNHIMATEYLNYEDGKFSKSRGVGVFGNDAQDTGIPSDIWRFYLASARPEGQDSSFSWSDLITRNNSELLNNLGNFVNRALSFAKNNFNGLVPQMILNEDDYTLLALCNRELKSYIQCMEKAKMRDGIKHMLAISRHGNLFMQTQKPWVLLKGSEAEKARAGTAVGVCCNLSYILALLMHPFMPEISRNLLQQLNMPLGCLKPEQPVIGMMVKGGHKLGEIIPLFAKLDTALIDQFKAKYGGAQVLDSKSNVNSTMSKEQLEEAIKKQGDKVRSLKSSGSDKSVWQPEVAILLDLKKQLEKCCTNTNVVNNTSVNNNKEELEKAIQLQGDKVRKLKAAGGSKATWQPEVKILLDLKNQLANLSSPGNDNDKQTETAEHLEEAIKNQGDKVRSLKASGLEKSAVQPEINILLDLKKRLSQLLAKSK